MALTYKKIDGTTTATEWEVKTVNGKLVAGLTVIGEAAGDRYLATFETPKELDGNKPFTLVVTTGENMTAAGTTTMKVFGTYGANASVGNTGTLTNCALIATNSNDLDAGATGVIHILPGVNGNVTQVTNASPGWSVLPAAPRYIFAAFTSADLNDAPATVTYFIYQ